MEIKNHFLNLVESKGGFKPLHAHFDKSHMVDPDILRRAQFFTMQEKWHLYIELKKSYTFEDIYSRSEKSLLTLLNQGAKVARTFVDADQQVGQLCIDAMLELKHRYQDQIALEIAVQPLRGVLNPKAYKPFAEACAKADLVGGLPSKDPDSKEHLSAIFDIATKHNLPVDVHVDQLNSPHERETELLLDFVEAYNFKNKVNAVHAISLAAQPYAYQHEIAFRLKKNNIGVIVCPSAAISMAPVKNSRPPHEALAPIHNSIAPISILLEHDVKIALGVDNIHDLFMPLVDGDLWFECRLLMEAARFYNLDTVSTIATNYV